MGNRIVNSASIVGHRKRPICGTDHLGKTAWLKTGRHQHEIRSPVGLTGKTFVEVANRHPVAQIVKVYNVSEMHLGLTVGHKDDFQVLVPKSGDNMIKDGRQQLTPFLNRIETRRPEKERRSVILNKTQKFLEKTLVFQLSMNMIFRAVYTGQIFVCGRIK